MVSSILTNNGAMTALQSLKSTQKSLLQTQNRISTGLKVSTAKDNAATWAVATSMRSDIANYKQVSENLSVSSSYLATAETAATSIADMVKQIRTKVTAAQNPAVDKGQVQADIDALLDQINSTAAAASFKGVNLVNGNGTQRILTSVNADNGASTAAYTDLSKQNLSIQGGSLLEGLQNLTVLSRADQSFSSSTDGVEKLQLNTTAVHIANGQELKFKYVDDSNTSRTLTVKVGKDITTSADLVKYLNADAGFSAMFSADSVYSSGSTVDATAITVSAKNRDAVASFGKYDSTTKTTSYSNVMELQKGTAATLAATDGVGTLGTFSAAPTIRRIDVTFAEKPLQLGDSFELKVASTLTANDADETATYKLKVVDGAYATGDLLVGDSDFSYNDNVYVIAVAASDVANPNVSAKNIGDAIQKALTIGATKVAAAGEGVGTAATADFLGAAASGESFGVTVDSTTGRLSIKTADALNDQLFSFNSSKTDYQTLLTKIDTATQNVGNAAATFGTAGNRIDMQKDFLDKLVDTLNTGLGALVDADMSEEAARLQALQVQEQLGTQALSIANQAPQSILSLFR